MNPRDWVRGCGKPVNSVRKHRQMVITVFFAPLISPSMSGSRGYKTGGNPEIREINNSLITNSPTVNLLAVEFLFKQKEKHEKIYFVHNKFHVIDGMSVWRS